MDQWMYQAGQEYGETVSETDGITWDAARSLAASYGEQGDASGFSYCLGVLSQHASGYETDENGMVISYDS